MFEISNKATQGDLSKAKSIKKNCLLLLNFSEQQLYSENLQTDVIEFKKTQID